jgi:hypothetical protein
MADGYDAIEAALQTILQSLTSVFATSEQVTRGDWRVMDRGVDVWAVLFPADYIEESVMAAGSAQMSYTTKLLLGVRYRDDGSTRVALVRVRDAVVRHLRQYPHLNGLASDSANMGLITSDGEPQALFPSNDESGPFALIQQFTIPTSEIDTVTIAE